MKFKASVRIGKNWDFGDFERGLVLGVGQRTAWRP